MIRIKESPFYRTNDSTAKIMRDVIIALLPVNVMAVVNFGPKALLMILSGLVSAVTFEFLFQKLLNRPVTITDLSAAVTGMLVGLSYVVTAPIWIVVLGAFIAIMVKQIPGGLGRNTFNPAVFSRVFIKIILTPFMTNWVTPQPDMVTTATPLEFVGNYQNVIPPEAPELIDVFMGNIGSNIGDGVTWAILIGGIYLVIRRVIRPSLPIAMWAGLFFTALLFGKSNYEYAAYHLVSGTAVFASVFMVTDYTSGPLNPRARIYYALSIGILTGIIRYVFDLPGGVGIAILVMNIFASIIDSYTVPRVFGHRSSSIVHEVKH